LAADGSNVLETSSVKDNGDGTYDITMTTNRAGALGLAVSWGVPSSGVQSAINFGSITNIKVNPAAAFAGTSCIVTATGCSQVLTLTFTAGQASNFVVQAKDFFEII